MRRTLVGCSPFSRILTLILILTLVLSSPLATCRVDLSLALAAAPVPTHALSLTLLLFVLYLFIVFVFLPLCLRHAAVSSTGRFHAIAARGRAIIRFRTSPVPVLHGCLRALPLPLYQCTGPCRRLLLSLLLLLLLSLRLHVPHCVRRAPREIQPLHRHLPGVQ